MIVALYLRHFKTYKGIKYIPISNGEYFSSYIGENGIGKSSILEAIGTIFKPNKEWNINQQAKHEGGISGTNTPFILSFFLIDKNKLPNSTQDNKINYNLTEEISSYLWNVSKSDISTSTKEIDSFIKHRDLLKRELNIDDYFLTMVGKKHENISEIYFSTFQSSKLFKLIFTESEENDFNNINEHDIDSKESNFNNINEQDIESEENDFNNINEQDVESDLSLNVDSETEFNKLLQKKCKTYYDYITGLYSYIYIPAETDVVSFTRLETESMQKLMDKNLQDEIRAAITQDALDEINKKLTSFVSDISSKLSEYEYKQPAKTKASLTKTDLLMKVIETFFSIRVLNKKSTYMRIPVHNLSSGEKRKALIDLAYTFLSNEQEKNKEIILAIDEPETSLNISLCFDQFQKLQEISSFKRQVIITTHWYGFIPIISEGISNFLNRFNNSIHIESFSLYNIREKVKQKINTSGKDKLPLDILLKSKNDLVQSIIASLRKEEPYNWIICEGTSEKIYFEHYFQDKIKESKLRVLPVGGAPEVINIFNYLQVPLNDKNEVIKGKVYCLIDTDEHSIECKYKESKNLAIYRLLNVKDKGTTQLERIDSNLRNPPTEIEDCLETDVFIETIKTFENNEVNEMISELALQNYNIVYYALNLRPSELDILNKFFNGNDNKVKFAKKYIEILKTKKPNESPEWVNKIIQYFD